MKIIVRIIKNSFLLGILLFLWCPLNIYAAKATDKFVTCSVDGTSTGTIFSQVSIPIEGIDDSGKYVYYGADLGIFKKPADYDPANPLDASWDTVKLQRVVTNDLEIQIEDFGDMAKYDYSSVYIIGYRVLYRPVGSESSPILETAWKKVEDSNGVKAFFKVVPDAFADKLVTCNVEGTSTGTVFSQVSIPIEGIDTSGKFVYYGADIGIFKKPSDYDPINPLDASWDTVKLQRVVTNDLEIQIEDFGDMAKYDYSSVYIIGYRILYRPVGSESSPIIETAWKKVEDSSGAQASFKLISSSVSMSTFTDRVTAANRWIDQEVAAGEYTEQHGQELNKYFPNSEVVSKFVLDPGGADVQKYHITFDANSTSIANLGTGYIKIVRIDSTSTNPVTGEKVTTVKWGPNENPGAPVPGGGIDPLCGIKNLSPSPNLDASYKSMTFDINNPGTDPLTVYVKYKFINGTKDSEVQAMPNEFENKVSVDVVTAGETKTLTPLENIIRLRKVIPKYM